jgi:hypothetical protein
MKVTVLLGRLGLLLALVAPATQADQPLMASWARQEVQLAYMGFTTRYSCDGLVDKTRLLLKHVGVRPDFKVSGMGCRGLSQITEFPRVKIVFFTPVIPAANSKDVGEPVPATWHKVTITHHRPRDLELGDCELVEQFRDRVLPLLTTRNVVDEISCIPHQLAGGVINLQFEVLRGLPSADLQKKALTQ